MNNKKEIYAVYGTLRLNQGNYRRILENNSKHLATTKVKNFKMFSLGGFPGIKPMEGKEIIVDLFEVSDEETKRRLDMLEGYNKNTDSGMYVRRKTTTVDNIEANIYIWNSDYEGEEISNGDWLSH